MVVERRARNASVHQPRGEGEGVGRCAQENVSGRPVQQGGDREERGALEGRCVHARVEEEVAKGLGEGTGGRREGRGERGQGQRACGGLCEEGGGVRRRFPTCVEENVLEEVLDRVLGYWSDKESDVLERSLTGCISIL